MFLSKKNNKASLGILIFELTQACNQSCRFCYNYWRDGSTPILPPDFNLAKRTLKKLYKQANVESISFSGGEPMLLPHIHDLVLLARRHGSHVNILTNGTLLKDSDIDIFTDLGVSNIQIPILSTDPLVHDNLTQLPGSWDKAIGAVKRAVAKPNGPKVDTVFILTAANKHNIAETFDLYRELGIENVMLNRFNLGGQGLKYRNELELTHDQLREAFATANDNAKGLKIHSGVCTPICILDPAKYPNIQFTFCSTDLKSRPIALTHTGDVRFCNHSPFTMGNIFKDSIENILCNPTATERYNAVPDKCTDCRFLRICNGGCRAASEQVHGTFALADPILDYL